MRHDIGSLCPVCQKPLQQEDDIVVCPVCGAPYHRACYEKAGSCVFPEKHIAGVPYEPVFPEGSPQKTEQEAQNAQSNTPVYGAGSALRCPQCGQTIENPQSPYCPSCGAALKKPEDPTVQPGMMVNPFGVQTARIDPEADLGDGCKAKHLLAFVGQNAPYFLLRFQYFRDKKASFDYNLSALLFGPFYFLYRKMYGWAAALMCGFLLLDGFTLSYNLYTAFTGQSFMPVADASRISLLLSLVVYAFRFVIGMFANRMYYQHCLKKIAKLRANAPSGVSDAELTGTLSKKGGASMHGILVFFIGLMALMMIVSAVLVRAYPDVVAQLQTFYENYMAQ